MAKHTTPAASQPLVIGAIFALTYWRSKDNERSELEDTKELKNSLARHGWSAQYPVAVIPIPTSASLNEEQKKAGVKTPFDDCMEERKALWEKHKAATDADGLVKKAVWERMFVRDGKLIEPKYLGNMGFRRSSCFVDAMVQRWNDSTVPDGEKVADVIPLMVKVYASEADRIIDQQLENGLQGVGTAPISDKDKLKIVKKLFNLGRIENDIRKLYQVTTTAQKLFNIVRADNYWPGLKIFERFFVEPSDPSHIPYGPVKHDVLIKFNARYDAQKKRQEKKALNDRERGLSDIDQEEVATYFAGLRTGAGRGNDPKIMSKKEIGGLADQSSVHFFRVVAKAILENDQNATAPYLDYADALNLHKALIESGRGDKATVALRLVETHPDVVDLIVGALDKLSTVELTTVVNAAVTSKVSAQPTAPASAPAPASATAQPQTPAVKPGNGKK